MRRSVLMYLVYLVCLVLSGLSGQPRRPERPKELDKLNRRLAFPWIGFRRPEFWLIRRSRLSGSSGLSGQPRLSSCSSLSGLSGLSGFSGFSVLLVSLVSLGLSGLSRQAKRPNRLKNEIDYFMLPFLIAIGRSARGTSTPIRLSRILTLPLSETLFWKTLSNLLKGPEVIWTVSPSFHSSSNFARLSFPTLSFIVQTTFSEIGTGPSPAPRIYSPLLSTSRL